MRIFKDLFPVLALIVFVLSIATSGLQTYADSYSTIATVNSSSSMLVSSLETSINVTSEAVNTSAKTASTKKTAVLATKTVATSNTSSVSTTSSATTSLVDAGAPLALPVPIVAPQPEAPAYTLNSDAASQLTSLGYSLSALQAQDIHVIGHTGSVPRKCATGTSGGVYAEGMALLANVTYTACANGESPVYEAYRADGYNCTIVYNSRSSKSSAVLAHELGHCLHFTHGQYRAFDINYREIRDIDADVISRSMMNELIAEDFMICHHGLDTNYGASSYYNRYGVANPTNAQCAEINDIIEKYLL